MKKPFSYRVKIVFGAIMVVASGVVLSRFCSDGNVAQTAENHRDAALRTRHYAKSAQNVAQEIEKLVPTLRTYGRNWKIVATSTRNDVRTISCEVPVLGFTDDLVISIRDVKNFSSVDIRSSSRVGKNDLGENRRHILQLLAQFDQQP